MKLHEFQAKQIFAEYGITVPRGVVVKTPDEACKAVQDFGGSAVIKAEETALNLLGKNLVTHQTDGEGVPVNLLLVEELADIDKELYVGLTIDRDFGGTVLIGSPYGGIEIEEVAANNPEHIHTEPIEPVIGLMSYQTRRLGTKLGLDQNKARATSKVMDILYRIFTENDCSLIEINPLIITKQGDIVALDGKIDIEDDSLFRHDEIRRLRDRDQEDKLEAEASDLDIAYVNLDGNVGCLVNGAGLAMATLDVANAAGAAPANFLDVGGGADDEKVAKAVGIILSDPKVNRVLVNVFGGILRCDIAARGIVLAYSRVDSHVPLVVRMLGTNVDEGKEILANSGLTVTFANTLTEAAEAIQQFDQ